MKDESYISNHIEHLSGLREQIIRSESGTYFEVYVGDDTQKAIGVILEVLRVYRQKFGDGGFVWEAPERRENQ